MGCCNCDIKRGKRSGWFGDPRGEPGTFFGCSCACHKHGGKYPYAKQKAYGKKHPETNPQVKDFPKWFEDDKARKIAKEEQAKQSK